MAVALSWNGRKPREGTDSAWDEGRGFAKRNGQRPRSQPYPIVHAWPYLDAAYRNTQSRSTIRAEAHGRNPIWMARTQVVNARIAVA
jgi:hypothetical protein